MRKAECEGRIQAALRPVAEESGIRYSPTKDVDCDLIYGRNLLGEGANWITVGLTVRLGDN
jgi:hypothetical protein